MSDGTNQDKKNEVQADKKGFWNIVGTEAGKTLGWDRAKEYYGEVTGSEGFWGTTKAITDPITVPILEQSAGILANQALAYGYSFADLSSIGQVLNETLLQLNNVNNPNKPVCKINSSQIVEDTLPPNLEGEFGVLEICLKKSPLYKAATDSGNDDALAILQTALSLISELNKPADPAECINPYFDQFFNLIPIKFIIMKYLQDLVKEALLGLSKQEAQAIIKDVEPCGAELEIIYKNNFNIPQLPSPLFKVPALPTIPNINLYTVLNKIVIEIVCYSICVPMTELIIWSSKKINEMLQEFLTEKNLGAGSYSEFLNKSLGKIDLNKEIANSVLEKAIIELKVDNYKQRAKKIIGSPPYGEKTNRDGLWRDLTIEEKNKIIFEIIPLIRIYFKSIYSYVSEPFNKKIYDPKEKKYIDQQSTRELGTKELTFLMLGEFNCFTIQDLINIGSRNEFKVLGLDNENKIRAFFTFLGSYIDPIEVVTKLKEEACPPKPCEEAEAEVITNVQSKMSELCKILNLERSGLPPIPINKILETIGLQDLFNQGIKEQFKQLKTEQLLFLGFPSITNYPTPESLSPFLPVENKNLNDYELWTSQKLNNEELFKKYLLRGGPKLFWKYDNYDLNKNLVGSTLEDVCGEDEMFTETYVYIFKDLFGLDTNKFQNLLETKKDKYKNSFEERVQEEFKKRKQDEIVLSSILKVYEDERKVKRGGSFDDDEEGLVSDFTWLYKTYKKSYDKQLDAKDRLRDWILGVRKDAGDNWNGIDVFNFVDIDMGYGQGKASYRYLQLTADEYDF